MTSERALASRSVQRAAQCSVFAILLGACKFDIGPIDEGAFVGELRASCVPCHEGCIVISDGADEPEGIAVRSDIVYWAEDGAIFQSKVNGLLELTSRAPNTLYSSIAVTDIGVFGVDDELDSIDRHTFGAPLDNWPTDKGARSQRIIADGAFVYWTEGAGRVMRSSLDHAVSVLADHQLAPVSIVVSNGFVYWANTGTIDFDAGAVNNDGSILRIPIDGGSPAVIADGIRSPGQIAVDDTDVYWVSRADKVVRKAPIAGGPVITIARNQIISGALAVDAKNVYWGVGFHDADMGGVMRADLATGTITPLASDQTFPYQLVADGKYVYWTDPGGGGLEADGCVVAIPAP